MTSSPAAFSFPFDFDEDERELGQSLFDDGGVDIETWDQDGLFEAEVRHFKRHLFVWVRRQPDGTVEHECDCPHFDDTDKGCEHLWALGLAVDAELADRSDQSGDDGDSVGLAPRYVLDVAASGHDDRLVLRIFDDEGIPRDADADLWADIEAEEDCAAFRTLGTACGGLRTVREGGGFVHAEAPFRPTPATWPDVLAALVATGRLVTVGTGGLETLRLDPRVADFTLVADGTENVTLRGRLAWPSEVIDGSDHDDDRDREDSHATIDLEAADLVVPGRSDVDATTHEGLLLHRGTLVRFRSFGATELVRRLRSEPLARLARAEITTFLHRLARDVALPRLRVDDEFIPLINIAVTPVLRVRRRADHAQVEITFDYDGTEIAPHDAGELRLTDDGTRQVRRSRERENDFVAALIERGAEADPDDRLRMMIADSEVDTLIRGCLDDNWRVLLDDRRVRSASGATVGIRTGTDWFEVTGSVRAGEDDIPLATLLAGWRPGAVMTEVGDDFLLLDDSSRETLERLGPLRPLINDDVDQEALRLSAAQSVLADGVLDRLGLGQEKAFRAMVDRFTEVAQPDDETAPADLVAELFPYQAAGLAWLRGLERLELGGCLADEMGLGKTIQAIAYLLHRETHGPIGPHLVVVPRSLVGNWNRELARFAPDLVVRRHLGPKRSVESWQVGEVVITTWGTLRRDAEDIARIDVDTLIADEAQAIKNPASLTARAAHGLQAQRRLALTGTPIENDPQELWSILEFVNPGLLGRRKDFVRAVRDADGVGRAAIARGIAPVLLRRTKDDVAQDLPDLIEQTVLCDMEPDQEALYRRLLLATRDDLDRPGVESQPTTHVLEALLRLRQIACHPALVEGRLTLASEGGDERTSIDEKTSASRSGKVDVLMTRLEELVASGRKALVFSQFTSLLAIVRRRLDDIGLDHADLDGSTKDRETPVDRFQTDPNCRVFLISLKAGGTGLNLTAADNVFILDPWWNPAVEDQAIARAHRRGRERCVVAQRLVSRGTVEEKVVALQEEKRALVSSLLETDDVRGGLDVETLRELITAG